MNKKLILSAAAVLLVVAIGVAAFVLRPPAEASEPIAAVPLDAEPVEESAEEPVEEPMEEEEGDEHSGEMGMEGLVFTIVQAESEVRFTLDEELNGTPTTVIGVSDQVAGEIAVDFETPANSQLGVISINARTLATDNNFRNRAIQNQILDTGEFEFIIFTPTELVGLPESAAVGDEFTFQVVGDLTIRDITNPVTFEVTVTVVSEDRLEGYGFAVVLREDFDLQIPSVPSVANVTQEVLLEIDFTALLK
jgi:polyisoprenoid-binding protein YceI